MPLENNFNSLIEFFLSVESAAQRQAMAEQIIVSLHEIRQEIEDTRLHGIAIEILANDIRQYSGELSDMEREILKFEISLVADMIA
ncbi:tRNA(Glu) U13 pseudouridine synthase TruD [Flavobacterium gossypii]|uniref:tRNA(Glu) U13 pseudouridine synthase TruD n=1 Tax=Flavobacterium gossypii TaxID=1646119 RepID=A0ABR6DRB7_9FLAO|nr:hypothetical protein [Flavobacterium gossypii]MBA9074230.1 tRNA(Glu) U13 pseudouridine synthase TruD [Flavobacterium gossypii]